MSCLPHASGSDTIELAHTMSNYIEEIIECLGVSQEDFAKRLEITPKNLSILVRGEQSLSLDIAVKLSRMLGNSIGFWLAIQKRFDERKSAKNC